MPDEPNESGLTTAVEEVISPTPSNDAPFDAEAIAAIPEVADKFAEVFGTDTTEAAPAPTRRRQSREADAEELEGLEGTTEADDGIEPEAEKDDQSLDSEPAKPVTAKADEATEAADNAPTLNPLLRQAAKRGKWSDEQIDNLWKENPELAKQTFNQIHESFNNLAMQYAAIGRSGAAAPMLNQFAAPTAAPPAQTYQPGYQPGTQPAQVQQPNALTQIYGQEKLTEMRERWGDDFMQDVLTPMVQPLQQMMQFVQVQQQQTMAQEAGNFFNGLSKEFGELYGSDNKVTEPQRQNRGQMAVLADQIRLGASIQGLTMSVSDALDQANGTYAAGHMQELERKRITDQVKHRSGQKTHRPTQRNKTVAGTSGQRSIASAEDAYERKARDLGLNIA